MPCAGMQTIFMPNVAMIQNAVVDAALVQRMPPWDRAVPARATEQAHDLPEQRIAESPLAFVEECSSGLWVLLGTALSGQFSSLV